MPISRIVVLADTADADAKLAATADIAKRAGQDIGNAGTTGASKFGNAVDEQSTRVKGIFGKLESMANNLGLPFGNAFGSAAHGIGQADTKGKAFLGTLSEIGKATLVGGIAAFGAAAYESVKGAADLQKQMEMIHTQAGASQGEVVRMTKAVEGMAGSVATGPQALAESLYHVESTGLRGAKALQILRMAAEGAKIGNANLVDVQNALDATVKSGIPGVTSYSNAMGQLNAIVGSGDMTMQDMADVMHTGVLSTARTYGVTLREAGAALAVFGDLNIRGAAAGTRLRQVIMTMASPSKAASQALSVIGLTSTQLAQDIRSGGFIKALEDLNQHLKDSGANATQAGVIMSRAFGGGKTSSGILTLLNEIDLLKQKTTDIARGGKTFDSSWRSTTQELSFKFDQLKASVQALADKFGTWLIPKLKDVADHLAHVVGWFERNRVVAAELGLVIASVLGGAIASFVGAKIGGLVKGISSVITWMGKWGQSSVENAQLMNEATAQYDAAMVRAEAATQQLTEAVAADMDQMSADFMRLQAQATEALDAVDVAWANVGTAANAAAGEVGVAAQSMELDAAAIGAAFGAATGALGLLATAAFGLEHLHFGGGHPNPATRLPHSTDQAIAHKYAGWGPRAVAMAEHVAEREHARRYYAHQQWLIDHRSTSSANTYMGPGYAFEGGRELISHSPGTYGQEMGMSETWMNERTHKLVTMFRGALDGYVWTNINKVFGHAGGFGNSEKLLREAERLASGKGNPNLLNLLNKSPYAHHSYSKAGSYQNEGFSLLQQVQGAMQTGSVTSLRRVLTPATAEKLDVLVKELVSTHKSALISLANQLVSAHKQALHELTELLVANQQLALADQNALIGQEITDMTTLLSDRFSNMASIISDKGQIAVDKLGERGLYGMNLVAQEMKVGLDKTTLRFDRAIGRIQHHVDSVTKTQDRAIQLAQDRVNWAANRSQVQQTLAANELVAVQNKAKVAEAEANRILAQAQGNAKVAEAQQQALIAIQEEKAATQYAGSGLQVNITGINPTDAAAVASAVGWHARTKLRRR